MATYFVSKSGSDSNSGTIISPWLTFSHAIGQLVAGDRLYIRGGSSQTDSASIWTTPISWPRTIAGSSGSHITFGPYTGEFVVIQPTSNTSTGGCYFGATGGTAQAFGGSYVDSAGVTRGAGRQAPDVPQYVDFVAEVINRKRTFVFDGGASIAASIIGFDSVGTATVNAFKTRAHHITFTNVEIKNSQGHGMWGTDFCYCLNCSIHDTGLSQSNSPAVHGIYNEGSNFIFDGGEIYNFWSSGVHNWTGEDGGDASDTILRNCSIHDANASAVDGYGALMSCGARMVVQNVNFYNLRGPGLLIHSGAVGVTVKNSYFTNCNTEGALGLGNSGLDITTDMWAPTTTNVYETGDPGVGATALSGVTYKTGAPLTTVRDCYLNGNTIISANDSTGQISNSGVSTTLTNNVGTPPDIFSLWIGPMALRRRLYDAGLALVPGPISGPAPAPFFGFSGPGVPLAAPRRYDPGQGLGTVIVSGPPPPPLFPNFGFVGPGGLIVKW